MLGTVKLPNPQWTATFVSASFDVTIVVTQDSHTINLGTFDVTMKLSDADAGLRSGMTAQLLFVGDTRQGVLSLPRQAVFLKDGKHIVYEKRGSGYEQKEVQIKDQTESSTVIAGLSDGTMVAMVDPTVPQKHTGASGGGTP